MKNSIDLFDEMMQKSEDIKQRKMMGEQLLTDVPDLFEKMNLRNATYSDGVIHVDDTEDSKPEPVMVDYSPDAEGMDPELFNDVLDSIQEIADINSGKIDISDYDIVKIQVEEHKNAIEK